MSATRAKIEADIVGLPEGLPLRWDVQSHRDLARSLFVDQFTSRDLRHVRELPIRVCDETPRALGSLVGTPVFALRDDYGEVCVFSLEEAAAYVSISTGSGSAMVAAESRNRAEALAEDLAIQLGAGQQRDDQVSITFWTGGSNRPRSVRRDITAPSWSDVGVGYAASTRTRIDELMAARVPDAGRLILWHGEPGTGKTSALRALGREWSGWCATHFVTDPEQFLGHGTGYLLDVLTAGPTRRAAEAIDWRLVVLEDAGELLTVDAHERTGQALSRLLNVSDGLLGQGMNVITLVTTNEPLGRLHPAVTRPGRCWRTVEFLPLAEPEANAWLTRNGSPVRVTHAATLAELYAALRGRAPELRREFGFGLRAPADGK